MTDYPLIFTLPHEIRRDTFSASVLCSGRALMTLEDGEWWCHGVEPGGLSERGAEPGLAFSAFKAAFRQILDDLADESEQLAQFKLSIENFVRDADRSEASRWDVARTAIRSGQPVAAPFDSLKREEGPFVASVALRPLNVIEAGQEDVRLAEAA